MRNKRGCKLTTEEILQRFRESHGDRYDYSKVEYVNSYTQVCIVCKVHGEVWVYPHNHWSGHGCWKCYRRPRVKIVDGKKKCKKCGEWVKLEDYHIIPSSGQVMSYCKECQRSYCRKHFRGKRN